MISPTERQARIIWLAATGLAVAVLIFLLAVLVWGLGRALDILSPVLWPLAVAGVLACLLDPVVDWFERKGLSRPRAIIAVFVLALVIFGSVFGSVAPQIVTETRQLANRVPDYTEKLQKKIELWFNNPPPWLQKLLKKEGPPAAPVPATEAAPNSPGIETN